MKKTLIYNIRLFLQSNGPLCILCLAAFCIRLPWLDLGLPQQYHPDEWAYFTRAFKLFKLRLDLEMGMPGLFCYLIFIGYLFALPYEFLSGRIRSPKELYESFYLFGDPYLDYASPHFLIIARLIAVVATVACGFMAGIWLCKRVPKNVALITVGIFFLLPLEFLYSRFGLPDLPLTAAMFLALLTIQRFYKTPSYTNWIIACSASVVSFGMKQPGAVVFVPLLLSLWSIKKGLTKGKFNKYAGLLIIITGAGIIILSPAFILPNAVVNALQGIAAIQFAAGGSASESFHHDLGSTPWDYLLFIFSDYGIVILAVIIFGVIVSYREKFKGAFIWSSALLFYFVIFQCASIKMSRYILPLTTIMLFSFFPSGLRAIFQSAIGRSKTAKIIVCIALFAYPLYKLEHYYAIIGQDDTRVIAHEWLKQQHVESKSIAREIHYTPILPQSYKKPAFENWCAGRLTISDLRKMGIDILIISDQMRFGFLPTSQAYRNYSSYFDSLQLLAHFERTSDIIASNPTIDIFAMSPRKNGMERRIGPP